MKTLKLLTLILTTLVVITSCKDEKKESKIKGDQEKEVKKTTASEKVKITLEKLEGSPAYTDAVLAMNTPENTKITSIGEIDFNFTVVNYDLGKQTDGANAKLLANSGKGQHIHFILNNQPYSAHYTPSFKKEVPEGVHHLVAFLSRSYHESVKNKNSVVVKKVEVGENPQDKHDLDMDAPTLIYSRPKGKYVGNDAKNVLLDFFVLNTELSKTGHKVRATINDETFIITEWAPYIIKGLPLGEVNIQLELIDEKGDLISGPFNKVNRSVTLTE